MAWDRRRRRGSDRGPLGLVANNLALVLCTVVALGVLVWARVQDSSFDEARGWLNDATAPFMEMLSGPSAEVRRWSEGVSSFFTVYSENQKLREEIEALRAAQRDLATLQRKVQRYEELLKIPADAAVTSVAARVIADSSGPFVRTVLINGGGGQGIVKGQAVVDERGLLGRVITTGHRSSRVLLLTDLNSRIPVMVEGANLKAILVGDNTGLPVLEYLPPGIAHHRRRARDHDAGRRRVSAGCAGRRDRGRFAFAARRALHERGAGGFRSHSSVHGAGRRR